VRKTLFQMALWVSVSAIVCLAAAPIANVSGTEPFKVSGVSVPVSGVSSWPVIAGDELSAGNAPVVLTFKDGSRVTLGKNSRATVEDKNKKVALRLLDGAMVFMLSRGSNVRLYSAGNLVNAQAGVPGTAVAGTGVDADAAALIGSKSGVSTAADCCSPPVISRRR
jgi:hypothetical protein